MKILKAKIILTLFVLNTLIATFSSASYSDVTMSVIEEPISTINFGTNSFVERSIISKNLEDKEITFQLKVVNNEENLKPSGEIMLVIDNSNSMLNLVTKDQTRGDIVINSAKKLITNLLEDNPSLQIGIVSFSGSIYVSKEGTIEDAKIVSELTNDLDFLISSVSNIKCNGPKTNLDAGIKLAKQYFTDTTDISHKYVIVLSDGVPNIAVDYDKSYYSDDVIEKTKSELESLSEIASNVIVMLTGVLNGDVIARPSTKTYNEIIASIFGTVENPTIGKFYYIPDEKIEETIESDIYKDLLPVSQIFTDIKVTDTLTEEIVENFEFSYVKKPNLGEISEKIDTKTNSITWNIPELKQGETAIVQYKLKLKENYDEDIVSKILDTHSKLDITYTNYLDETDSKTSDITPTIKLTEPEPTPEEIKKDEESRPEVLPAAGKSIFFASIGIISIISIILGIGYYNTKIK